jgi:DNA-binding GntR family transcriptional regulator
VRCEFGPGALLSDRKLSELLSISRTLIREALMSLETAGLVSRRGRVGWMVAEYEGKPTEGGWTQHN